MSVTRRFIAGAVCPQCAELDRLVLYVGSSDNRRECISCGYRDALPGGVQATHEPPTRVNQPRPGETALPHEDEIAILKLDPGRSARKK